MKIRIRPLEPHDVEPVASLLAASAREFITVEFAPRAEAEFLARNDAATIRKFAANGFRYHVAEAEGDLIGFVGVREDRHLHHLFVAKPFQRRGIGRMMWEVARAACEAAGHGGPFTVNASNNAVPVYERWGFRRAGPAQESNGVIYNPMRLEIPDESESTFRVARASTADIPRLLPLVAAYWDFESLPGFDAQRVGAQLERLLTQPAIGAAWIAYGDDGAPAGYLLAVYVFSLEHLGITAEIDELFVVPQARDAEVGSRLLAAAEAEFTRVGCTNVSLQLRRENDAARRFYRTRGYAERSGFELLEKTLPPG